MATIDVVGYVPGELSTISFICSDCKKHCGPEDTVCKYCGAELEPSELLKQFEPYDPFHDVPEEYREDARKFCADLIQPDAEISETDICEVFELLRIVCENTKSIYMSMFEFGREQGCGYDFSESIASKVMTAYSNMVQTLFSNVFQKPIQPLVIGKPDVPKSEGLVIDKDNPFMVDIKPDKTPV